MGSVKDLKVIKNPSGAEPGRGVFEFSDRYSVFDWGGMPQEIRDKGRALAVMGAYFFELFEEAGLKTHYRGLLEEGEVKRLGALKEPSASMEVDIYRVIRPERTGGGYDYSAYRDLSGNFLIPLEVIYRNSLPEGSSVFRRLEKGSLSPRDLGFDSVPEPGSLLEKPFWDVSTKLEDTDRYVTWEEAARMGALSEDEVSRIREVLEQVNGIITRAASGASLENVDGKIELAFDPEREISIVDVAGTPDECRFRFRGMSVSKELARKYYRKTGWYSRISEAKSRYGPGWRDRVPEPPEMEEELIEIISRVYTSAANAITGKEWFDTPALEEVMEEAGRRLG